MSSEEVKKANDCEKFRKHQYGVRVLISKYNNTRQLDRYRIHETCHVQSDPSRRSNGTESQTKAGGPMGDAAENSREGRHLTPWPFRRQEHYHGHLWRTCLSLQVQKVPSSRVIKAKRSRITQSQKHDRSNQGFKTLINEPRALRMCSAQVLPQKFEYARKISAKVTKMTTTLLAKEHGKTWLGKPNAPHFNELS